MRILERLEKFAEALLKPINPAAVVLLGIYTMMWGLWVIVPFWDVFTTAKLFSVLLALPLPEAFWGGLAMACGSVTTYGAFHRGYESLTRGAQVAAWHWLMIACFYFAGDFANTGGITALFFAIYAAYIYLNIKINYRYDRNNCDILH